VCGHACIAPCWSAWQMPRNSTGARLRSTPRPLQLKGGTATGPNPTDRGKPSTKRDVVVDRTGTPLGLSLSGANRHDSRMLAATLDAVPPVRHGPRRRPDKLHADKAYEHRRCRIECRRRSIVHRIARCGVDVSERLGRYRWTSRMLHLGADPEEKQGLAKNIEHWGPDSSEGA
jgi:hypothetical protein